MRMGSRMAAIASWMAVGAAGLLPQLGQAQDVTPSVMFLLDNNEAMQDFPQYLPEAFTPGYSPPANSNPGTLGYVGPEGDFTNTGCTDPALVFAMSWFDKNSADPAKNGSIVYDSDSDFGATPFFQSDNFYHARGRRIAWQTEDSPYSLGASFTSLVSSTSTLNACYQMVDWNTTSYYLISTALMDQCQVCLLSKGWWRGPRISANTNNALNDSDFPSGGPGQPPTPDAALRKWIVSGRVLNVRPPRFVIARKALKDVISAAPNVRMGVATFGPDHGWFDPPELLSGMRPTCDQSQPINETALNRPALRQAVNKTLFRNSERSTGEALFGLGGYFSSQQVDGRWQNWFQQPISPGDFGWPGCCNGGTSDNPYTGQSGSTYGAASDEWLKQGFTDPRRVGRPGQPWEGTGSDKSVCFSDQITAIILLTTARPATTTRCPSPR